MRRIGHLLLAILFLLFALVQWNDGDFLIWMPPYLITALIAMLAYFGRFYRYVYLAVLAVLALWMASYLPHIARWFGDGMPNIAGSMKAESPYIELTREFFGLFLCTAAIWYYYILSKRNHTIHE